MASYHGTLAVLLMLGAAAHPWPGRADIRDAPEAAILKTEQVTLRLVTGGSTPEGLRGAVLVDLEPGWKTYWIDPGDSGLPPVIDLSATPGFRDARLRFPAPHRSTDEYGTANVYSEPVAFAFTLQKAGGDSAGPVRASVSFGVCRDICIPVTARLAADPARATADEKRRVARAFAALPEPPGRMGRVRELRFDGEKNEIVAIVETPAAGAPQHADLFLTGPKGWFFGKPESVETAGDDLVFRVPVLERPRRSDGPPDRIDAVFTADGAAFEADGLAVGAAE